MGKVSWSEQAESDLESLVANPAVRAQIKHIAEEILHDIPPRTCADDGSAHGIMWHRCITWEQKRQLEEAELEEAELEEAELEEAELEEAELEEARSSMKSSSGTPQTDPGITSSCIRRATPRSSRSLASAALIRWPACGCRWTGAT